MCKFYHVYLTSVFDSYRARDEWFLVGPNGARLTVSNKLCKTSVSCQLSGRIGRPAKGMFSGNNFQYQLYILEYLE